MTVEVTWTNRGLWISNIIFQQCVAVVVVVILTVILQHSDINNIGTWHIVLCTLGYALFMAEAVVIFTKTSILTMNLNRKFKGYIHGVLMSLAIIFVTTGISLKIYQKNDRNLKHFTTDHGITGLTSWLLGMLATIIGVIVVFFKNLNFLPRPILMKFIHNFLGTSSYSIGMACLALGLYKTSFKLYTEDNTRLALVWVIGILTVFSLIGAMKSFYSQIKSVFFRS